MRPKKVVMVADADVDRLSRFALVLQTWGYHVESAVGAPQAAEMMADRMVDVLVVEADLFGAENLIARGRELWPGMRSLMLGYRSSPEPLQTGADVFLPRMMCVHTEIREQVRILCVRKRGPKTAGIVIEQDERKTA